MACIKMGVSTTHPKQQAAIPFFGHTEILHMLISMGSTVLAAAVGINEVLKKKKKC